MIIIHERSLLKHLYSTEKNYYFLLSLYYTLLTLLCSNVYSGWL